MRFSNSTYAAIVVAIIALFVLGAVYWTNIKDRILMVPSAPQTTTVSSMRFEIADTEAKQELGLGNRASIPDNYGMLFVFKDKQRYGFWMKDMLAPIDITWLSDTGEVILVDHSVEPSTYPHIFYPPVPVKYVVETRAGYAADHNWVVGTKILLPSPYGS